MIVRAVGVVLGVLLLAACAPRATVVVLPDKNGTVGTVTVESVTGKAVINQAYATAQVRQGDAPTVLIGDAHAVRAQFAAALAAQPQRPASYLLYFLEGRDELVPDSKPALEAMFADLAKRASAEVTVIGHTDRVGRVEYNDQLSLQRAERVRQLLISQGISPHVISVAGRGEREPVVATDDEVPEPRNRRVEISVR